MRAVLVLVLILVLMGASPPPQVGGYCTVPAAIDAVCMMSTFGHSGTGVIRFICIDHDRNQYEMLYGGTT